MKADKSHSEPKTRNMRNWRARPPNFPKQGDPVAAMVPLQQSTLTRHKTAVRESPTRASIPLISSLPPIALLDRAVFTQSASVFSDHAYFLPTEASVFYRHAEEQVFILLVVSGKGVLVEQHQFRVIRAGFREIGKLRSDGRDQAGLSLHALVIRHRAMRIADSESA
jgi:hypothetical protein